MLWELANKFTISIAIILQSVESEAIRESEKQRNLLQEEAKRVIRELLPCNAKTATEQMWATNRPMSKC